MSTCSHFSSITKSKMQRTFGTKWPIFRIFFGALLHTRMPPARSRAQPPELNNQITNISVGFACSIAAFDNKTGCLLRLENGTKTLPREHHHTTKKHPKVPLERPLNRPRGDIGLVLYLKLPCSPFYVSKQPEKRETLHVRSVGEWYRTTVFGWTCKSHSWSVSHWVLCRYPS